VDQLIEVTIAREKKNQWRFHAALFNLRSRQD
jgi:hypothetical protein